MLRRHLPLRASSQQLITRFQDFSGASNFKYEITAAGVGCRAPFGTSPVQSGFASSILTFFNAKLKPQQQSYQNNLVSTNQKEELKKQLEALEKQFEEQQSPLKTVYELLKFFSVCVSAFFPFAAIIYFCWRGSSRLSLVEKETSDLGKSIDELKTSMKEINAKIDVKFDKLDAELDVKFDKLDAKLDTKFKEIDSKFDNIDTKFTVMICCLVVSVVLSVVTLIRDAKQK